MRLFSARKISLALVLVATSGTAFAGTWQAALRERFVSAQQFPYGGDSALRIRRNVQDLGFTSFTLITRLQMTDAKASHVFASAVRSRRTDLETMISSVVQGKGEVIFKPVISIDGDMGVVNRLTGINPTDPNAWFTSYQTALSFLATISAKREIHEIVLATGMHHLWTAQHADAWTSLGKEMHRRSGNRTRVSIEISSDADVTAFETWQQANPDSLKAFAHELNVIRISASPVESYDGAGDWNLRKTADLINNRYARIQALFPLQTVQLANVTVPGCRIHHMDEDEVICESGAKFDKAYQAAGINAFLGSLSFLDLAVKQNIQRIEFLMASTDFEPAQWDFDSRFPYYNDLARRILLDKLHIDWNPTIYWKPTDDTNNPSPLTRGPSSENAAPSKKACIYYDSITKTDKVGPIHARMMENLMGAFRSWTTERRLSTAFKAGDTASCDTIFYVSTNYMAELSSAFYEELATYSTDKTLVWMNYHFGDFEKAYNKVMSQAGQPLLAFSAPLLEQAMEVPSPQVADPGFFRYFEYKGETFEKLSKWDYRSNRFMSSPELALVKILDESRTEILSQARHSRKNTKSPYVVRQKQATPGTLWYFADSPLSYVHYEDRYLILCDLMWDILKEKAPDGPLGALVRLEDLNPSQNSDDVRWAADFLGREKVPFSMAMIPYYADSFGSEFSDRKPSVLPVTEYKEFMGSIRYALAQGGNLVWHGVYHHAGDHLSGFDGTSGPDYEFWLYPEDTPLPEDSVNYVLDQLEKGEKVFQKMGVRPVAWEVPHYASSALDSVLFGKLFEWNFHRSLYFWSEIEHDAPLLPKHRMLDCLTAECKQERRRLANELKIKTISLDFAGQPVPFRVWKDSYGQALIPETLGMIDYVFYEDNTWRPVSHVEDLLRRAKLLRVVRGSFASFFWHPDVANPKLPYYVRHPGHYESEGGKHTLQRLIYGLRDLGYEFKSIADCSLFPQSSCDKATTTTKVAN